MLMTVLFEVFQHITVALRHTLSAKSTFSGKLQGPLQAILILLTDDAID